MEVGNNALLALDQSSLVSRVSVTEACLHRGTTLLHTTLSDRRHSITEDDQWRKLELVQKVAANVWGV